MGINQAGLSLVKRWEGLSLTAYRCAAGVWTIGYGHTGTVKGKPIASGTKITKAQAEELLQGDLNHFWDFVNNEDYVPAADSFGENQKAALCSFAFNCGENALKTLCRNRSKAEIAEALLLYNKAGGQVLTGLTQRRQAERSLFLTDEIGHDMDTLKRGAKGQQVAVLQTLLGGLVTDGCFGALTEGAVRSCQADNGLKEDGIAGAETWKHLLGG